MKNKLLICFRPDFVDDPGFSTSFHSGSNRTKTKSAILERESSKGSEGRCQTPKRNLIRSFSGVVRPVLFDISLKKKSHKRKPSRLTIDSKSSESGRSESSASSSPTSSMSSSSSSTANEYLTRNGSGSKTVFISLNQRKHTTDEVSSYSSSSFGLFCVLTMSLGITLFYGRVCAVFFTTLCLYLLSRWRNNEIALPECAAMTSPIIEVSARDYRKRIIMEGMLTRKHPIRTN